MAKDWKAILKAHPELRAKLTPKWNDYIPHDPTPKQQVFLLLQSREALFGGAAGGGKSDALLMAALQYVDVPNYSAVIFRRQLTDLNLEGALIPRSLEWLSDTDAKFKGNKWFFPSGATIEFGYLKSANAKYRYQGSEFQFIAFDELTQFPEEDYLYLFSRLRKAKCPHHEIPQIGCASCREYAPLNKVPLRLRGATNPGGTGHLWVKKRFDIGRDDALRNPHTGGPLYTGRDNRRPFIPSFVQDNPYLDIDEYLSSLSELDPVTREQLMNGDWGVSADGRFRKAWARYYTMQGDMIVLGDPHSQNRPASYHIKDCECFIVVDPAASSIEGPADIHENRAPSHFVVGTFLLTPGFHLLWWDNSRFIKEIPDATKEIVDIFQFRQHLAYKSGSPNPPQPVQFVGMEWSPISVGMYQELSRRGLPMKPLLTRGKDKVVRATDAMNRMEQGKIWLPGNNPGWLEECETELFTWTGHPHEEDDQIDVLAYAAMEVSAKAGGVDTEVSEYSMHETVEGFVHEQTYIPGSLSSSELGGTTADDMT